MRSAATILAIAGALGSQTLSASMTPGEVVRPSGKSWQVPSRFAHASASFSGTVSSDGRRLAWRIAYARLGDPRLVIADVHVGGTGRFGPVLVRLCGPCKSGQHGVTRLKAGDAQKLVRYPHYVTLITDRYPNGIVRGQLLAR